MKLTLIIFFAFVVLNLSGQQKPAFLTEHNAQWVDSVFNSMTLDQKIGQLLMPRGNYSGKAHDVETLKMWVRDFHIGGIVFFASNPTTQATITNELQALSKIPLIIGQDFEWGVGMRLDSADRFPYAATIGAIQGHENLLEAMGSEVAKQCKRIGVHINYAPVVDVNNNPNNPVINFRSYGADKENVASKGLAYMVGMQKHHVLCTAKHFPGHGDTDVDSHHDLPLIPHDRNRLHDVELYPFKKLIAQGLSGIMTAHLNIPAFEPNKGLASTFSPNIVFKLLREDLKFQGLTFTDAMEMQGAVKNYSKGEAMVMALLAGNDVLETFMDVPGTVIAIKNAVKNGTIPLSVINFKVKKILMAKSWVGLDKYQPVVIENLVSELNTIQADILNYQLTEKSITCLKNDLNLLPIKNLEQKIAVLSVDTDGQTDFYSMVSQYTQADFYHLQKNASDYTVDSILQKIDNYDLILAAVHLIDIRSSKNYGLTTSNTRLLKLLAARSNVVISLLGNPYILTKIPELAQSKSLVMAYQQSPYTEKITPQVIFGALPAEGVFPIHISKDFNLGMGVKWPALGRLSYGIPELVGIDRAELYLGLDSIVGLGLAEQAFPGCVLQIAKDGMVIFSKAYGFHTYEDAQNAGKGRTEDIGQYKFIDDAMDNPESLTTTLRPVSSLSDTKGRIKKDHIFDFASVTKVSAATLGIMQLISENKINLDNSLGTYCPSVIGTNKANLKMKDLLTHRAGLKAWIPFWKDAIDTVATMQKAILLEPTYENECFVTIIRPSFIKRLFGKKSKKTIEYLATAIAKPALWARMLTMESRVWKPNIFSKIKSEIYSVTVAQNMYLHKNYRYSIMKQIADSPLETPNKYVYSDLHYYYYPEIIQNLTGQNIESYLAKTYKSIGANSLTFNPLSTNINRNRIVPTEYDSIFRQQLLHGYVHDEGAAMLGGISGHAGLFGNANDLTKLMQMYLQRGSYGSVRFINSAVVDQCSAYQFPEEKNRRGIGFDKKDFNLEIKNAPSLSSDESYGHSGYTGTYTWIDPKYNLVYVFLSNRVYPSRNNTKIGTLNIRPAIGDHIIQCIMKK
ncbi:MAG: serine hydrolase [Saprospiraceae bacterium]|nr:serine hydrolase [Saprospiraceae bacterium]